MRRISIIVLLILSGLSFIPSIVTIGKADSKVNDSSKKVETHSDEKNRADDHSVEKSGTHGGKSLGEELPLWTALPFVGILLSIALFPLIAPEFWHHHFPKLSAMWAILFAVPFLIFYKGVALHEILHIYIIDYIPFIILLWALFTISGGIVIRGTLKGSPVVNVTILLIGSLLASWIGTTGAAMLLIRPILKSNSWRKYKVHTIVFFIFSVCNIGGSLTPLGDPPLFLGFLHSVPFFWTLTNLLPHMAFAIVMVLIVYFILDSYYYKKEDKTKMGNEPPEPLKMVGTLNFLFLFGVIGGVLMSGTVKMGEINIFGIHQTIENVTRDGLLILMGILSLYTTKKELREANEFSWFPIQEVAYLFAGIFMTIIPALAILKAGEHGALAGLIKAVKEPYHYFWVTGILSSFLDNAPTYLTFFNTALGSFCAGLPEPEGVAKLIQDKNIYLQAIATGAVFMGANTYIGNAPNFMVKSIAEEAGIKMPSFFGYLFKYSVPVLIPIFILVSLIFF